MYYEGTKMLNPWHSYTYTACHIILSLIRHVLLYMYIRVYEARYVRGMHTVKCIGLRGSIQKFGKDSAVIALACYLRSEVMLNPPLAL